MLIAERLLLLSLDPRRGTLIPAVRRALRSVLGAALLAELILFGRLALAADGRTLAMGTSLPVAHPLLEDLRRHLWRAAPLSRHRALQVSKRRPHRLVPLLLEGLFRRDLLHRHWAWLRWRPGLVYPLRSRQPVREALAALLEGARDPSGLGANALFVHLFLGLGRWSALPEALAAIGADPDLAAGAPAAPQPLAASWRWLMRGDG